MDSIAGTGLSEREGGGNGGGGDAHPPALLAVVLDTSPHAWAELAGCGLTLARAVGELLVFVNAHLAADHANRVAVVASHCRRTAWLYPSSPLERAELAESRDGAEPAPSADKYRPFALVEHELLRNLRALLAGTTAQEVRAAPTGTPLAGALTLALSYIMKQFAGTGGGSLGLSDGDAGAAAPGAASSSSTPATNARVLVVSTSGDLAAQYIPLMNVVFAAQHLRIPLDILKLAGDAVLLQQAAYTTAGVFLAPAAVPRWLLADGDEAADVADRGAATNGDGKPLETSTEIPLLPTLLFAFLPAPAARARLVAPSGVGVDFRAACFCHRRVLDLGYVCSICLSIFCEEGVAAHMRGTRTGAGTTDDSTHATCLTCGTRLSLRMLDGGAGDAGGDGGDDGRPRRKKRKKQRPAAGGDDGD